MKKAPSHSSDQLLDPSESLMRLCQEGVGFTHLTLQQIEAAFQSAEWEQKDSAHLPFYGMGSDGWIVMTADDQLCLIITKCEMYAIDLLSHSDHEHLVNQVQDNDGFIKFTAPRQLYEGKIRHGRKELNSQLQR